MDVLEGNQSIYMSKAIRLNKEKKIGKVLFIVEGSDDEIYILNRIFTSIFDYQYESKNRLGKYKPRNIQDNPSSSIFVINTEESNIKFIYDANGYLNNLFTELINEYNFPADKATIFYLFDRDIKSNTERNIFEDLIEKLSNSRESNEEFEKPGLLLLSYPAIESFIVSNFFENSFQLAYELGSEVKRHLHTKHWTSQRISSESLENAVREMLQAMKEIGISEFDLDNFKQCNKRIYDYQENYYSITKTFRLLCLLCIALIDLGLVEIDE